MNGCSAKVCTVVRYIVSAVLVWRVRGIPTSLPTDWQQEGDTEIMLHCSYETFLTSFTGIRLCEMRRLARCRWWGTASAESVTLELHPSIKHGLRHSTLFLCLLELLLARSARKLRELATRLVLSAGGWREAGRSVRRRRDQPSTFNLYD